MNPLITVRLIIAAIVTALLIAGGLVVHGWRSDSLKLGAVRQELADVKAAQEASHKASEGLQDELTKLRSARKPSPTLRLCRSAKPVPQAGTGRNDPATGAGELPAETRFDTQPLYDLADEADELAARLRACQALLK
jgi:hypothetical protein